MKKIIITLLLTIFSIVSFSQGFNEADLRKRMKNDGLTQPVIEQLIKQQKEIHLRGQTLVYKNGNNPVPFALCSDMGVENGWGAWLGDIGTVTTGAQTWTPPPGVPIAPNFNITNGAGVDPCTPSVGNPPIPVVAPGFGNSSIQLGQPQTTGCVAEQLTYQLTVGAADTNFLFAYALVIQDAGHTIADQPFVSLCIYDAQGNQIPCGCFRYTGSSANPGFFPSLCGAGTFYKPWTTVGINLKPYLGQTLTVVILNVDCAQCGHYAHSYWDFTCKPLAIIPGAPFCAGQQATICAPADAAYTYTWSLNGSLYTGAPNANAQCINPFPIAGDTFVVNVGQPSGCGFKLVYVPTPVTISTAYTFTYNCMTATFTDGTPLAAGPITNWSWNFGDGTTSTLQNPTHTYSTVGTFTATLTVTNASGCTATVSHTVTVIGPPQAVFSNTLPCLGTATSFSNGSISPIGDPINTYLWNFGDGTPTSNLINPSHTYAAAGTYTVTLTVTTIGGCTDVVTQTIVVYGNPIANFSAPDSGCSPVCQTFTDLSLPVDGNIVTWQWAFIGGSPAISTIQNPTSCWSIPGTYSVSLTVTTNYGCKNSVTLPMIQVFDWPSANFCFAPSIAPYTDPNFIFCDIWSSDVTNWYWNFGDGSPLDSVNTDPAHSYSAAVTNNDFYQFTVTLYVKNVHGCWDTITKIVEIVPEYTFYIPNTFTPNNDFINETFFGKGRGIKEYNIWLFDRWGNLIWNCEHSDKNTNWDGVGQDGLPSACKWPGKVTNAGIDMNSTSNQLAQEDVYVWKVRLVDVFDKRHMYIGHVNVVK